MLRATPGMNTHIVRGCGGGQSTNRSSGNIVRNGRNSSFVRGSLTPAIELHHPDRGKCTTFVADHGDIPDITNHHPQGNVHTAFGERFASSLRRHFERDAQRPEGGRTEPPLSAELSTDWSGVTLSGDSRG